MAATRTPKPLPDDFPWPALGDVPTGPFAVAFSAGADSTALLHACVTLWPDRIHAIHINHGLQAAAADFEWHARHLCARWSVPLTVCRVQAQPQRGQSPEDAARSARYPALAQAAQSGFDTPLSCVLLAQHAHDQAESVLLAWSRGAGLSGLAAMPGQVQRHGVSFVRPWLQASGVDLRQTLRRLGTPWVEDPTNASSAYTRNRIRHQVLPVLEQALPGSRQTLVRTARHAAQAMQLLADLAQQDAQQVGWPPRIADLRQLPQRRQANLLRHWLAEQGTQAQTSQLDELLRQVAACQTRAHRIELRVGSGQVRRQGDNLAWLQWGV
ncbi:MAG: tRNA lysidine(34) synthetase TilS [Alphaproteobacteria bacterium]|nr:tRNA lysidine(34) synthetase TilS [Alphaproteobacteria bacterium]